jgi:hypothetical protein
MDTRDSSTMKAKANRISCRNIVYSVGIAAMSAILFGYSNCINCYSFLNSDYHSLQAWAQGPEGNLLFPNATTPILGNQSIIPGMHVMSLVQGVKSTWLIISSENELSVNLRYTGQGTSPAISLVATALKTAGGDQQIAIPTSAPSSFEAQGYQRLTGSNATNAGWISPMTIPLKLEGEGSLYDDDLIIVMVAPNTGPLSASNSSTLTSP